MIGHTDFEIFEKEFAEQYHIYDLRLVAGETVVSYESSPVINGVKNIGM